YVLMEHKSSPDAGARLQLLRYVVRILVSWYKQNKEQLPLPAVIPLLVSQGPDCWKFSCEFVDLFGDVPTPLLPYLPSFRHALVDLSRVYDLDSIHTSALATVLEGTKIQPTPGCLPVHRHTPGGGARAGREGLGGDCDLPGQRGNRVSPCHA